MKDFTKQLRETNNAKFSSLTKTQIKLLSPTPSIGHWIEGDSLVYFVDISDDNNRRLLTSTSSQINKIYEKYEFVKLDSNNTPYFKIQK